MIIKVLFFVALLKSSYSISFQCEFIFDNFGSLGKVYQCFVKNNVTITSPDATNVDWISKYSNFYDIRFNQNYDNVEVFSNFEKGKIHYFPRGLEKFFKNLKGLQADFCELKEIHQSDLKPFPKLTNLYLSSNELEIIEADLFKFNPNLEFINLNFNNISHIQPNVFDNLYNLNYLYLQHNANINIYAYNSSKQVQNVIKIVKTQCTNSDYAKLEQKLKNLENKTNLENLKENLEKLDSEIKETKFINFFKDRLEILKAVQTETKTTTIANPTNIQDDKKTFTTEYPPNQASLLKNINFLDDLSTETKTIETNEEE